MENWKPIAGYEGRYDISDKGNVRSRITSKILKALLRGGYRRFRLADGHNGGKWFTASRLVASTFIPNPDNKPEVNHKDGDKNNDSVSNLEWATCARNTQHAYDNDLATRDKRNLWNPKLRPTDIPIIRSLLATGQSYSTVAAQFGVSIRNIALIKQKKIWINF